MISIITAIYNQFAMNELFVERLKKYTTTPYELIIIDNNSTDGSRELFEKNGAIVIRNEANYSYPYCQNQGIRKASGDVLVFLNNDLIVSLDWDVHLLHAIGQNNYEVVSFASNDRGSCHKETITSDRRWKRIKYAVRALFGCSKFSLQLMFKLMYANWEKHTRKIFKKYGYTMVEGFSGSAIAMTRAGLEKVGWWDESQQGADFDLYARTKKRYATAGDVRPLSVMAGVYIHHYGRLTIKSKQKPPRFADSHNIITVEEKWGIERQHDLVNDLEQYLT